MLSAVAYRADLSDPERDIIEEEYADRFMHEERSDVRCPGKDCTIRYTLMVPNTTSNSQRQVYKHNLRQKLSHLCPKKHPDKIIVQF